MKGPSMAVKKAVPEKKAVPAREATQPAEGAANTEPAQVSTTRAPRRATTKRTAKPAVPPASMTAARKTSKATPAAATSRARKTSASSSAGEPRALLVRDDETPWTAKELKEVRTELEADIARLQREISMAESELAGLMRDAGDGAGDDQADAGTKTFEREQEISLANNARVMFEQSEHALERIVDRSYGICESCGAPIGKNRLLAFPRATLCMPCKSKQERR
jgi:RNA polymerase-binding protein DksA